ncbi:putative protein ABC-type cobalt transport system, ATPase component [Pyrococcus sp. NA2]|nr:putative protein ABC-type cobalt transport system, ATPase component [Pyrococcus sp. NA2]
MLICDRIALLYDGRVIKVGKPNEILRDFELLKACNLDVHPIMELFLKLGIQIGLGWEEEIELLSEKLKDCLNI